MWCRSDGKLAKLGHRVNVFCAPNRNYKWIGMHQGYSGVRPAGVVCRIFWRVWSDNVCERWRESDDCDAVVDRMFDDVPEYSGMSGFQLENNSAESVRTVFLQPERIQHHGWVQVIRVRCPWVFNTSIGPTGSYVTPGALQIRGPYLRSCTLVTQFWNLKAFPRYIIIWLVHEIQMLGQMIQRWNVRSKGNILYEIQRPTMYTPIEVSKR